MKSLNQYSKKSSSTEELFLELWDILNVVSLNKQIYILGN